MNTHLEDVHRVHVRVHDPKNDGSGHDLDWKSTLSAFDFDGAVLAERDYPLAASALSELPEAVATAVRDLIGRDYVIETDLSMFGDDVIEADVDVRWAR